MYVQKNQKGVNLKISLANRSPEGFDLKWQTFTLLKHSRNMLSQSNQVQYCRNQQ
jgi:hypothetical protein